MDADYLRLKGEIELWREMGSSLYSMSGRSWIRGAFVITDIRLLFIRSFDPPYMRIEGCDHVLWQLRLEDIINVSTFKPSSLVPRSVRINTMDRQYILNLNSFSSNFTRERIVNTFNRYVALAHRDDGQADRQPLGGIDPITLYDFIEDPDRSTSTHKARPSLPEHCYACGSSLQHEEICWLDRNIFQCPSCGSRLKIGLKNHIP